MSITLYKEIDRIMIAQLRHNPEIFKSLCRELNKILKRYEETNTVSRSEVMRLIGHLQAFGFLDDDTPERFKIQAVQWLVDLAKARHYL